MTLVALGTCGLAIGVGGWGGSASASDSGGCSDYARYTALASATGVRTAQSAPGASIVSGGEGSLPQAQSQVDSVSGSVGWAGAPYSPTVAENVGASGKASPNDVPVFAFSQYPANPEVSKTTPAATIHAKSGPDSATASVDGGGPSSTQASTGRVTTSSATSCGNDGIAQALADSTVDMVDIEGVFRIGSVRSHARVTVDPASHPSLEGTMTIDGATVNGQAVAITDQGVVTGSSTAPLPANPLAKALSDAGINVRYVAAVKNPDGGDVIAPGLDVTVSKQAPGVGSRPATTTYTFGEAHARASHTAGSSLAASGPAAAAPAGDSPSSSASPVGGTGDAASAPLAGGAPTLASAAPSAAPSRSTLRTRQVLPAARIANTSSASVYAAVGIVPIFLGVAWALFERLGVKLQWR